MGVVLPPFFKPAVHAVDLGKVFLNEKLCGALAAIAVVAVDDQRRVRVGAFNKLLLLLLLSCWLSLFVLLSAVVSIVLLLL